VSFKKAKRLPTKMALSAEKVCRTCSKTSVCYFISGTSIAASTWCGKKGFRGEREQ
jgi:hypothetical protein